MGLKNHVAGLFTSSQTHRCLNIKCAKRPMIFYYVGVSGHRPRSPVKSV